MTRPSAAEREDRSMSVYALRSAGQVRRRGGRPARRADLLPAGERALAASPASSWRSSRSACWPSASTSCSTRCCGAPAVGRPCLPPPCRPGRRRAARPSADGGLPGGRHRPGLGRRWTSVVVIEAQEETGRAGRAAGRGAACGRSRGAAGADHPAAPPAPSPSARPRSWRQGAPPCPLCGLPLDTEGHICPRQNGHRPAMPERSHA